MKSYISINQSDTKKYPSKETLFRPSKDYPEYLFHGEVSEKENSVYAMIRESMHMLKMDDKNYGTSDWNPLGQIIKTGDNVLIKPNMVLHHNNSNCGEDCLYTHPSLVAAMIDYVLIALHGEGKIIVGDAPLQECDFDRLVSESGYKDLIEFYFHRGIDIHLVDFRNVKTYEKDGLHYLQSEEKQDGVVVRLDEYSAFNNLNEERIHNFRITNYDPRILQKHHDAKRHEYNVSPYVLNADVIINMPKPKTHRKAGVTISLKNLVGINANKEYLPHHTVGSSDEGGDAYKTANYFLSKANMMLDLRNELMHECEMQCAGLAFKLYEALYKKGMKSTDESYWEGSWYGNDTIWRTIVDLNRILYYANKEGVIGRKKQRKLFIVADMIVSGQKEGPLEPTPVYPGTIVMGDDPVWFDRVVCSIMGFDYRNFPSLFAKDLTEGKLRISASNDYEIISNNLMWNKSSCEAIEKESSLQFEPTMGWIKKLGNKYRDGLISALHRSKGKIYIFGAGLNGIYAEKILSESGIKVTAFIDNNKDIQGKIVTKDVMCISPDEAESDALIVVGMRDEYLERIRSQICEMGCIYVGVINKGS